MRGLDGCLRNPIVIHPIPPFTPMWGLLERKLSGVAGGPESPKSRSEQSWFLLKVTRGEDCFQAFLLHLQMAIFSLCFLPLCIAVSVTLRSWG